MSVAERRPPTKRRLPLVDRVADRLIVLFTGVLIVLLVAGLTHFSAVLLLPYVASKDAYTSLAPLGTTNRMVVLPPERAGEGPIPFRDPAMVVGICYFDVSRSPLRIRMKTEDGRLLTLSFHTPQGKIFYSMTDRAALRNLIDIRLVTPAQLKAIEDGDEEDAGLPTELRLKAPTEKGLIVATALVARPGERDAAEAAIKATVCQPEPLPPPG